MRVLVIAEIFNEKLSLATRSVITAAKQLGQDLDLILLAHNCDKLCSEASRISGIKEVFIINHNKLIHQMPEYIAKLVFQWVQSCGNKYDYILTSSTNFGKSMMPIIAAKLDVAQYSDIIKIIDYKTFVRPMYAGNALATIQCLESIVVMTIRPTAFVRTTDEQLSCKISVIEDSWVDKILNNCFTNFISQTPIDNKRPELSQADIVVSGGRGMGDAKNFQLIYDLADLLNAAVGASRAAVDAGYISNEHQVGQTGVVVAPVLYVAIGISGAIQHLSGMKDSKIIVAINKDPNAPIMQIATYKIVGDLFKIIPDWIERIKHYTEGMK